MSDLRIDEPGRVLPTLPGKVSGVVAIGVDERGKTITTVQCATCLRTATGITILAVNWADFGGDGDPLRRLPARGDASRAVARIPFSGRLHVVVGAGTTSPRTARWHLPPWEGRP